MTESPIMSSACGMLSSNLETERFFRAQSALVELNRFGRISER